MSETNWPLLLGVVATVFGGAAVLAATQICALYRYRKRGRSVTGTVARVTRHHSSGPRRGENESAAYSVVVSYRVADNDYEIALPLDTNPPFYTQGKPVPVYYFPDHPQQGRVVCFREYAKWLLLLIVCLSVVIAVFVIWAVNLTNPADSATSHQARAAALREFPPLRRLTPAARQPIPAHLLCEKRKAEKAAALRPSIPVPL